MGFDVQRGKVARKQTGDRPWGVERFLVDCQRFQAVVFPTQGPYVHRAVVQLESTLATLLAQPQDCDGVIISDKSTSKGHNAKFRDIIAVQFETLQCIIATKCIYKGHCADVPNRIAMKIDHHQASAVQQRRRQCLSTKVTDTVFVAREDPQLVPACGSLPYGSKGGCNGNEPVVTDVKASEIQSC